MCRINFALLHIYTNTIIPFSVFKWSSVTVNVLTIGFNYDDYFIIGVENRVD